MLDTQTPTHKWVTITYNGKETNFITNLFRKTNLKIAFQTSNTGTRHIHTIRSVQIDVPQLQDSVCGANW